MNRTHHPLRKAIAGLALIGWALATLEAGQLPAPTVTASATPFSDAYTAANLFGPDPTWPPREYACRSQGPVTAPFTTDVRNGTWVELDFGTTVTFNQFIMRSRPNAVDIVDVSRLIVSADPTFDATDSILTFSPSGSNGTGLIQTFPAVTGRYVRWEVTAGSAGANLGAAQMWFMSTPANQSLLPAPTVSNSATPFNDDYAAAGAVNGDVGNGGAPGHEYASQAAGVGMYIDFDFGSSKPISGFDFWNRPVDAVTAFDLIFSNTSDFSEVLATKSFTASEDGNQSTSATFEAVTARYVRLQATANAGGENTGVNEIQFYTPGLQPPEITLQPQGGNRVVGDSITLSVQAVGALPLLFEWRKDGQPIPDATQAILTLTNLQLDDTGEYRVVVSNSAGQITSEAAVVTVTDPPADITTALVLHLAFDETSGTTAADSSGNGNNASLYNFAAEPPIWVPGRLGRALEFNQAGEPADDDQVLTDGAITFANPDQYSFAFWARPKGYTTVYNPRVITPWNVTHWVLWKAGTGVGIWPDVPVTPQPAEGVWRHFVVTYDRAAGRYAVYADGVKAAENVAGTRADPGAVQWVIGHPEVVVNYIGDGWRGALDDVRIYNRLLSAKDVRALYDQAGIEPAMIGRAPQGGAVFPGERFVFTVNAGGTPPLSYQWKKGETDIPGATGATLVLDPVKATDAGEYTVVVSNSAGTATSAPPAVLTVKDPPPDVTTGLVLHLKLDETSGNIAADASGTGNNGELIFFADPAANWVAGILGGGLWFHSNLAIDNEAILVPAAASLDFSAGKAFSLASWVKGAPTQKDSAGLICRGFGGGGEAYCIDYWGGGYRFFVRDEAGTGVGVAQSTAAPNDTWQLIVAVYDQANARMKIYVNGAEAGSGTPPATLLSSPDPLDIGCRQFQGGYTLNFDAVLDDVRIYSRALSPKDIAALYAMGVPPDVTLTIGRSGNNVVITWPAEATGFVLESSPQLPATTWTAVPGVTGNSATVTPTGGSAFYRLRKP